MGSYNTSCFVTRQTISEGDRCAVVPIVQQSTYSPVDLQIGDQKHREMGYAHTSCYSTRHWAPLTYFLQANYSDRSETELTDSVVNRVRLLNFIAQAMRNVPSLLADEKHRDRAFDLRDFMAREAPDLKAALEATKDQAKPQGSQVDADTLFEQAQLCWQALQEQAQQQRLFWHVSHGVIRPMSFAVMHGATFDALLAMTENSKDRRNGPMTMRSFFDRAVAAGQKAHAEAALEKKDDPNLHGAGDMYVQYVALEAFREEFSRTGAPNDFRNSAEMSWLQRHARSFFDGKMDADTLFKQLKPGLESHYVCSALEAVNAHFEPMVYAGQDYSNHIGKTFLSLVRKVSAQVTRENDVRAFGTPERYTLQANDPEAIREVGKLVRQRDASWEIAGVLPAGSGAPPQAKKFEVLTSLPKHLMQRALLDFEAQDGNVGKVQVDSLQQLEPQSDNAKVDRGTSMNP